LINKIKKGMNNCSSRDKSLEMGFPSKL